MQVLRLTLFVVLAYFVNCEENVYYPVVLWHGMGDSALGSLEYIKNLLEKELNHSIYVKSLEIGGSYIRDVQSGYIIHPDVQIRDACNQIKTDAKLKEGYNAIGFSQGSQFLRALAQRCPEPPMKNFISLAGQHQGVYGLPNCPSVPRNTCNYYRRLLNYAAYAYWIQSLLVQATYWHSPLDEDLYRRKSTFLAEINNEMFKNETYIKNLQNLKKFVMVKFMNDEMVDPIESSWFGFYKPGQAIEKESLQESRLYMEDRLGLKQMMEDNKLVFLEKEGKHLQIEDEWFIKEIVPYLSEEINLLSED